MSPTPATECLVAAISAVTYQKRKLINYFENLSLLNYPQE